MYSKEIWVDCLAIARWVLPMSPSLFRGLASGMFTLYGLTCRGTATTEFILGRYTGNIYSFRSLNYETQPVGISAF